jgi:hypothetical protein
LTNSEAVRARFSIVRTEAIEHLFVWYRVAPGPTSADAKAPPPQNAARAAPGCAWSPFSALMRPSSSVFIVVVTFHPAPGTSDSYQANTSPAASAVSRPTMYPLPVLESLTMPAVILPGL